MQRFAPGEEVGIRCNKDREIYCGELLLMGGGGGMTGVGK